METLGNKIAADLPPKFVCNICAYFTSHKSHYDSHLHSLKHSKNTKMETNGNKIAAVETIIANNCCELCNKEFTTRSGLWKHKTKGCCTKIINTLQYDNWKTYYEILKNNSNVIIGASENLTGNLRYGNDWILENINLDIENIYFNDNIINYQNNLSTLNISQN